MKIKKRYFVTVHPPPLTPPTRGGGNFHPLRPRQRGTFPPPVPLPEGDKGGGGRSGGSAELLPKLKQIEGFVTSSNKSPFPTSSRMDRCHVNYMAYRTIYQKEIFRHKMHSPDQDLECYQCHDPDYGLLYDAWKDVLDSKTKQLYKNNTNTFLPTMLQQTGNIQNPLRLVQSYGVHNFRLSQMLLKSMDHD